MAYADPADVVNRFKPLKSMLGVETLDVSSSELSSIYINDACSLIDGYLGSKYVTPIVPTPQLLTQISCDLSIFNILVEKAPGMPDWMQARYDRAIKLLELIRDGSIVLSATIVGSLGDNFAWSTTQDYHSIFSPVIDELSQSPDQDRVDVELNERADDAGNDCNG